MKQNNKNAPMGAGASTGATMPKHENKDILTKSMPLVKSTLHGTEGGLWLDSTKEPGYWAVLPARVRYDSALRPNAKILYAEITALSNKTGFCWAKNSYFAQLFNMAERTVSDLIGTLEKRGHISIEVINDGGTVERRIYTDRLPMIMSEHIAKNGYVPPNQKSRQRTKTQPDYKPNRFLKLWDYYPHKKRGNKQRAIAAWERLHPEDKLIDQIALALQKQLKSEEWTRGIGIPHVSTYLNKAYWEDADDTTSEDMPGAAQADPASEPEVQIWT